MVKIKNYSLITALPFGTSTYPHIHFLVFLPVGMTDVQWKSLSVYVCYFFLSQAGINGATCMMILHKITSSIIQNIAFVHVDLDKIFNWSTKPTM